MERIGVLGGTFDPIHHAHLAIAEEVRVALNLDRVLFVPAAQQPLKDRHLASPADRLAMVQQATAPNLHFAVCEIEIQRDGPSYSVDTLAALHEAYPAGSFWFILGADAAHSFGRWHEIERLAALTCFALVGRPAFELDLAALEQELPSLKGRIQQIQGPQLDLSATEIRARVAAGLPIRYLVPDAVAEYIAIHHLYK